MDSLRQQDGCAHKQPRLAHSWTRRVVSRVKKMGHRLLPVDIRKSHVNQQVIIKNFSEALK